MSLEKILVDIFENMDDLSVRSNLGIFHTVSSFHKRDLTQAFLEGYENTRRSNPELPELPMNVFEEAALLALKDLYKKAITGHASFWLDNNYSSNPATTVYIGMRTVSPKPFTLAKSVALVHINKVLKSLSASQIIADNAASAGYEGISDKAFRSSGHMAHSAESSVGGARTLLAIKSLELADPVFQQFIGSREATKLRDLFDSLDLSYDVTTKNNKTLILNQKSPVLVSLQAASENLSKVDTDASKLKSLFTSAVIEYSKNNFIIPEDLVAGDAEDYIFDLFSKNIQSKAIKVAKSYRRSAQKLSGKKKIKGNTGKGTSPVGRNAKLAQNKKKREQKSGKRNLAMLLTYMRANIVSALTERMGPPGSPSSLNEILHYQTGRFVEGVQIRSAEPTKQSFLRVEYAYERPYDTFEQGNAQGSIARDPRRLIKMSIEGLIEDFARVKGWGTSPFGRIYPVKMPMRAASPRRSRRGTGL